MKKSIKIALGLTVGAAALFSLMLDATAFIMGRQFGRGDYPEDRSSEQTAFGWYPVFEADYPREEVEFQSGRLMLRGWIYGAEHTDRLLVFAHGIGDRKSTRLNSSHSV